MSGDLVGDDLKFALDDIDDVSKLSNVINNNASVTVAPGRRVEIFAERNAGARQKFKIVREVRGVNEAETLCDAEAPHTFSVDSISNYSIYHFAFEGYYEEEASAKAQGWQPARELRVTRSAGGNSINFGVEDHWSTDGDFDDTVLKMNIV